MNSADLGAALLQVLLGNDPHLLPTARNWKRWAWFAQLQRVVPLLDELVRVHDTDLDPDQRRSLEHLQLEAQTWSVRLEHNLLETVDQLAAAEIDVIVLKGLATSYLDYPDPSWRQPGDIDILVRPGQFAESLRLLTATGWIQGYPLPVGHEDFTHAVTVVRRQIELDVHQRIAHRAIGLLVATDMLFAEPVTYDVAGRSLSALSDADRLIHATLHMVTSRGETRRLSSVADVLMLARRLEPSGGEVVTRADAMALLPLFARGVRDAYEAARLPVPPGWAHALDRRATRHDRLVDRAYLGPGRRPVAEELAYVRLMSSHRSRLQYVRGHLRGISASDGSSSGSVARRIRYLLNKARER